MRTFHSPQDFWAVYGPLLIAFAIMAVLTFLFLRLLLSARRQSEMELARLLAHDPRLYLERLEHNRLLKLVFRKPVLLLYRMDGYMKTGDDTGLREMIAQMDKMTLEPRDRVDYLQKRMSFFISVNEKEEARDSFRRLERYLTSVKAEEKEPYRDILEEGREIVAVYLDREVSRIPELEEKAEKTTQPVRKGILYFRLAKLSHFHGDTEARERYLKLAALLLARTDYEDIILQAFTHPDLLEMK